MVVTRSELSKLRETLTDPFANLLCGVFVLESHINDQDNKITVHTHQIDSCFLCRQTNVLVNPI